MADNPDRIRRTGKQIMLDDRHLADARDEDAAEAIVICMNRAGPFYCTKEEQAFLERFLA